MRLNKIEAMKYLEQGKELRITRDEAYIIGIGFVNMNSAKSLKKELKLKTTLITTYNTHNGKDWLTRYKSIGGIYEMQGGSK